MTGDAMTKMGEGERLEALRRRRFWTTIAILFAGGMIFGAFVGANAAMNKVEIDDIWGTLPTGAIIAVVALSLIAFAYGTWRFVKVIDEVELVDNLWGSTAGYYVYAALFPAWWALAKGGVVGEPNDWLIYFAAMGGATAVYLHRKWRVR